VWIKTARKPIPKNSLRNIRILKNPKVSQWILALKSNVPQSRISLIENCLSNPTPKEKEALASALNIDVTVLFPQEKTKGEENENVENA
jgi:transcriptional regulator with XRE-family HTH domain